MAEATPLNAPLPRAAHAIEQAFYQVKYAVAHLARSTTGEHRLMRPDEALRSIAAIEAQLGDLKALLVADEVVRESERAVERAAQAERAKAEAAEQRRLARNEARRQARAATKVEVLGPVVIPTSPPAPPTDNVYVLATMPVVLPAYAQPKTPKPFARLKRFFKAA